MSLVALIFFAIIDIYIGLTYFRRPDINTPPWKVKTSALYCILLSANYMSLTLGRGWLLIDHSAGLEDYQSLVFLIALAMIIFHLWLI